MLAFSVRTVAPVTIAVIKPRVRPVLRRKDIAVCAPRDLPDWIVIMVTKIFS